MRHPKAGATLTFSAACKGRPNQTQFMKRALISGLRTENRELRILLLCRFLSPLGQGA
jgi:hypothetical protein